MHQGLLFTREFLRHGIAETSAWNALTDEAVTSFRAGALATFTEFPMHGSPNEAQTETDLIFKILEALDWVHYLPQQSASARRRTDVPDALMFAGAEDKARANAERNEAARYKHGIAIVENKAWRLPLDRVSRGRDLGDGVPSTQILRYLSLAEVQSNRRIQWGMLTNGQHWRLYYQYARSRAEEFLELDLLAILGVEGLDGGLFALSSEERDHWLRVFILLFRREAFLGRDADGRTFHQIALDQGRWWEEKVAKDLSHLVFAEVFAALIRCIVENDPNAPAREPDAAYLDEVKQAALILLYRLLFVLYAEDRNLLPVDSEPYRGYSLRFSVREPIATMVDQRHEPSTAAARYYGHARDLFRAIGNGDPALRLPPYNGGLFDPRRTPILERVNLPDSVFAPVIDKLARQNLGLFKRRINFRDLSVQQLGSIYERLLEFEPVCENGGITIRLNPFARKDSGSFYTPEELVGLIIEKTVGPLIDEKWQAFEARLNELASDRRPKAERLQRLAELDPATAILSLKVCDPAMGSGHFLVTLVDYLGDRILETVARSQTAVPWAEPRSPYESPLIQRIEALRTHIRKQAERNRWNVPEAQLDDRHLIRRIILKRVVHGVDMNPMAVELAKVSLWLHTFTVGAPLSFLDHHLRCGNSLYGERVRPVMDDLSKRFRLLINPFVQQAKQAAAGVIRIENLSDSDIGEVKSSAETFASVVDDTAGLKAILDVRQGLRWLGLEDFGARNLHPSILAIFDGTHGDPKKLLTQGGLANYDDGAQPAIKITLPQGRGKRIPEFSGQDILVNSARTLARARERAREQVFLHWEIAFPDVWDNWDSEQPLGGFDAIIGNPPWDRLKMQEVEWFAAREMQIAMLQRASERQTAIENLRKASNALVSEFEKAKDASESAARVARSSGDYPLLSAGDINIYSLFVERAINLINPKGIVGLVVPSGIVSDLTASNFFKKYASSRQIISVFDFINKKHDGSLFFKDVYYRFKFCAFIVGGNKRQSDEIRLILSAIHQ